jgi:hypothetical protein
MPKIFKGCEVMDAQELDGLEMYPHNVLKTSTYYPLPHFDFYNNTRQVLEDIGIGIVFNSFGLTPKRDRMFMWLETDAKVNDMPLCIGGRNSYDKSTSAGLCVGTKIMVCSNKVLASYENGGVVSRKHTSAQNIDELSREFSVLIQVQTENNAPFFAKMESLKEVIVPTQSIEAAILRMVISGVIAPTDAPLVWHQYSHPSYEDFHKYTRTAYGLLMACTEVFKLHKGADYQIRAYDGVAKALGL